MFWMDCLIDYIDQWISPWLLSDVAKASDPAGSPSEEPRKYWKLKSDSLYHACWNIRNMDVKPAKDTSFSKGRWTSREEAELCPLRGSLPDLSATEHDASQ